MERRAGKKRRDHESNSIHLNLKDTPIEESKGQTMLERKRARRRGYSDDSEEEKIPTGLEVPVPENQNMLTDGFVVKDSSDEKYYVIKNNGLIVDQSKQDYKTITDQIRKIPFTVQDPTSSLVTLLKSPFKDRLETYYFPYPDFCIEEKSEGKRVIRVEQDEFESCRAYFRYDTDIHIYNSVIRACNEAGMFLKDKKLLIKYRYKQLQEKKEMNSDIKDSSDVDKIAKQYLDSTDKFLTDDYPNDFNIRFMMSCKKEDLQHVKKFQKLNHFPYSYYLGRKDQLYRNYQVQEDLFPGDYNYMPKTYIFPKDAEKFRAAKDNALEQSQKKKYWIFKPTASSCGRGIKVISPSAKIPLDNKGFLISEYLADPHLIKGLKYDLRLYVVVTSYDPLIVYIYNDGLVRFCTKKYKLSPKTIDDKYMHLSNYSLQKKSEDYKKNDDASEDSSKWNFTMWEDAIRDQGHDVKIALLKIEDLVIKTLITCQDIIANAYDGMTGVTGICYELYGFDIMFDAAMNPWLLEVNTNPSLSSNSTLDKMLKTKLVCDMLTLVGVKPISFPELRMKEQYEGNPPLKRNEYEGCTTHEERNQKRAELMNSINFANLKGNEVDVILNFEEEFKRMGNFRRVFPNKNNFRDYTKYFFKHSFCNLLLWKYLKTTKFDLAKYKIKKYDYHI